MIQKSDEIALERLIRSGFGVSAEIRQIVAWQIPVSHTDKATVFLTTKKQLYVYIEAQSRLVLADVKKIISRMGLRAESYLPPKGHPDYFKEIGREKFSKVFPGRNIISEADIMFYSTLAPYAPALVRVAEVKESVIRQYDTDSAGDWRVGVRFAYRRISTS